MNIIRSILCSLSGFVGLSNTDTYNNKECWDDLKTYLNTAFEERTKVLLEYMKQVSLISHDLIHTQIKTTEQNINENLQKIHGNEQTLARMKQVQDNMDNIVRTVNTTETKIASLSIHIEELRKAIGDTIDDVRTQRARDYIRR